jgi:hypothetical protein
MPMKPAWQKVLTVLLCTAALWIINGLWLMHDTRPPSWDMAVHQSYALNYLPGAENTRGLLPPWSRSGNYPPFVHLAIAFFFVVLHPGPHIAILANIPASLVLFWALYELASDLCCSAAARWACALSALVPYLIWMSRETILDYWLSAWVAASLVLLRRTRGFESHSASILFGGTLALGLLTKWIFAGFLVWPVLYVCLETRIWRYRERIIHLADSLVVAGIVSGFWYVPNIPRLMRFFTENAQIGAREGEPPVFSFQSLIYYLRLLEGYQFFALLFALLLVSCIFVWRDRLLRGGGFLAAAIAGGWFSMTLLRTKDARFTMPLLGLLIILVAVWITSWGRGLAARVAGFVLMALLCLQAYAANFGISWLPQRVVLARGYQGSLRWDWNLYLQDYYILGAPRREDWKQAEILQKISQAASSGREPISLAVVPDLPRFNAANFDLMARYARMHITVDHPQSAADGIRAFDGFNYVLMTEGDQGMPWTTTAAPALNKIIVDEHEVFRLLGLYPLPNGDYVRLYFIQKRGQAP